MEEVHRTFYECVQTPHPNEPLLPFHLVRHHLMAGLGFRGLGV